MHLMIFPLSLGTEFCFTVALFSVEVCNQMRDVSCVYVLLFLEELKDVNTATLSVLPLQQS